MSAAELGLCKNASELISNLKNRSFEFYQTGRLTGLNYDGVRERHITSSLHFSWIYLTVVDLNMTEKRHTKKLQTADR